jgi:hypothetical protein
MPVHAMTDAPTRADAERFETLRTLLDSASTVLAEITGDPLFGRMARAFSLIPAADREAILSILEREVQARATADAAGEITGMSLRLNPSARLYTRVLADEPRPNRERAVASALRAIRVTHGAVAPMDDEWKAIAREALCAVGPRERASMAHFAREILALVCECEGESPAAPAP